MRAVQAAVLVTLAAAMIPMPAAAATATCAGKAATMVGSHGPDQLTGTAGADVIVGLDGDDTISGGGGNDRICSGTGYDVVYGGDGNDILFGQEVFGGPGHDLFRTEPGPAQLWGGTGEDRFIATATASPAQQLTARGGAGDDRFHVSDHCAAPSNCAANDLRFAGGEGSDRIQVVVDEDRTGPRGDEPYRFDLQGETATNTVTKLVVHLRLFDEVVGTEFDDTIIGTSEANYLMGGFGDDTIEGWGANDLIAAGTRTYDDGIDTIRAGRGGADICLSSNPYDFVFDPGDEIVACEDIRTVRGD